jgi:hypothetical protein
VSRQRNGRQSIPAGRACWALSHPERDHFQAIKEFEFTVYASGKSRQHGGVEARCPNLNDRSLELAIRGIEKGLADGKIRSALTPLDLTLPVSGQLVGFREALQAREQDSVTPIWTHGEALLEAHCGLLIKGLERGRSE